MTLHVEFVDSGKRPQGEVSVLLKYCDMAGEVAREAFAAGDLVTGIAAVQLAAQLIQLARLKESSAE